MTAVSPFTLLNRLLEGLQPGKPAIAMSVGDPQHPIPPFIAPVLAEHVAAYGRYPSIIGPLRFREAVCGWLARRYGLKGALDPERHVLPLNGTREGLFLAAQLTSPATRGLTRPAILMPNPFYQCYAAAAEAAGAEPIYLNATAATGFLPDLSAVDSATWARTTAVYLCSPSNPEGAIASDTYWTELFALSDRHGFIVLADECYSEIYDETQPPGALQVRHARTGGFARVLAFNSLSKRSSLAGLRSGFVAGDPELIRAFQTLRNVVGPTLPVPIAMASAAAWEDEAHVTENRSLYRDKIALANRLLGQFPGYRSPAGGFFLWLECGDGAAFARRLWGEQGVRVLPGRYLARDTASGNPGAGYVRIALVNDFETTRDALQRIAQTLAG